MAKMKPESTQHDGILVSSQEVVDVRGASWRGHGVSGQLERDLSGLYRRGGPRENPRKVENV